MDGNNIIILTTYYDESVDEVIDWIHYYKKKALRIISDDVINIKDLFYYKINQHQFSFKIKFNSNIKNICAVWIRKGAASNIANLDSIGDQHIKKQISNHLFFEVNEAKICFVNALEKNYKTLGTIPGMKRDKITQLLIARESGLVVPETIITNSKAELINFKNKRKSIITKCIKDSCFMRFEDATYGQFTEIVPDEIIEKLPDFFAPSMSQECLGKDYDIRIFYINGEIYAMAIITNNKNIDFRKDYLRSNIRYVPYKLPVSIQKKVKSFMKNIRLNTGSIDMVKTKNGRFVFIEVNPSGQFGMVSYPCNYYIEQKIADFLCKN